MWSGVAGTCISLLALGVTFIVVASDHDPVAQAVVERCMPAVVHLDDISQVSAGLMVAAVERRGPKLSAILAGGGSPCQGNSAQQVHRRGWEDERSQQPLHLKRVCQEIEQHPKLQHVAVLRFLENVASMPPDVCTKYSKLMDCEPVYVNSDRCGYATRARLLWGHGPRGGILELPAPAMPPGWQCQVQQHSWTELAYCDKKPLPGRVVFGDGYEMVTSPEQIVQQQGKGAMHTFTREFEHPEDRLAMASPAAQQRFRLDGKRFSPPAYEDCSLVWKQDEWMQPSPQARCQIQGIPEDIVDAVPHTGNAYTRRAIQNSLIGDGFHTMPDGFLLPAFPDAAGQTCQTAQADPAAG